MYHDRIASAIIPGPHSLFVITGLDPVTQNIMTSFETGSRIKYGMTGPESLRSECGSAIIVEKLEGMGREDVLLTEKEGLFDVTYCN